MLLIKGGNFITYGYETSDICRFNFKTSYTKITCRVIARLYSNNNEKLEPKQLLDNEFFSGSLSHMIDIGKPGIINDSSFIKNKPLSPKHY